MTSTHKEELIMAVPVNYNFEQISGIQFTVLLANNTETAYSFSWRNESAVVRELSRQSHTSLFCSDQLSRDAGMDLHVKVLFRCRGINLEEGLILTE